ncbi:hypothetical protein ABE042_00730 [Viridibacillus arvi]|uniref:hypothetical protein n=1 Tax=Viridibacillus arvi TaxID=263475 RepID=UPI003D26FE3E
MGKYSLKFIKPLVTLTLGAAIVTGAVVGVSEDASAEAKYKISNGLLVSKATGKVVDGTVTYKGKVYKKGKLLTGTKGNVYYKSGKRATGSYKGKYYLKGKLFTGMANGSYYKNGSKATGVYKGIYYNKGKAYTGLANDIYYKNGKKATGTFEGKYYLKGIVFTGLHPKTRDLYIDGVLNLGYRIYNGDLYNGARLNVGIIQYNGLWYDGKTVANGTIKTPGGQIITVINGIQTSGGSTNQGGSGSSGGYYQSELSKAIELAKVKLAALQFYKANDIDNATKLAVAKLQYNEAKIAVDAAIAKGAVVTDFGNNYSKLASQKTEIDRYESAFKAKLDAINAAENKLKELNYTEPESIKTKDNWTEATTQVTVVEKLIDEAKKKGAVATDIKGIDALIKQQQEIQRYEKAEKAKADAIAAAESKLAVLKYTGTRSIKTKDNWKEATTQITEVQKLIDEAKKKGAVGTDIKGIDRFEAQQQEIQRYETAEKAKADAIDEAKAKLAALEFFKFNSIKNQKNLDDAQSQYKGAKEAVEAAKSKGALVLDLGLNYLRLDSQGLEIKRYETVKSIAIQSAKTALKQLGFAGENSIKNENHLKIAKSQYYVAQKAVEAAEAKGAVASDFGTNYSNLEAQQKEIIRYEAAVKAKLESINAAEKKLSDLEFYKENSIDNKTKLATAKKQYDEAKAAVDEAKKKGAVETEIKGIEKLEGQQNEITRFEKALTEAIDVAKAKIAALSYSESQSINNNDQLMEAQGQYNAAKAAVDFAFAKGAVATDFEEIGKLEKQQNEIARYETAIKEKAAAISEANKRLKELNFFTKGSIKFDANLNKAKEQFDAAKTAVDAAVAIGAVATDFGTNYSNLQGQQNEINRYEAEVAKNAAITEAKDKLLALQFVMLFSINSDAKLKQAQEQYDAAKTAVDAALAKGAKDQDFILNYWRLESQQKEIKRYEAKVAKDAAITNAKDKLADLKFTTFRSIKNSEQLNQAREQYDAAKEAVDDAILKGANKIDFVLGYLSLDAQKAEIERYSKSGRSLEINNLNEDGSDLESDVETDIKDSEEENKEITEDKGTTEKDKEVTEDQDKGTTEEDKEVAEGQDKGTTENQDKETTEDQNNELTGVQS